MVGAGVFTTSGFLLADLGSPAWVMAAWAVGGVIAACGALCYGALARALPGSGGEYHYLARAVHPAAGLLAGWISLLAGFAAPAAAAALGLQAYLTPWLGGIGAWSGSLAILAAGLLHGFRVAPGVWAQNLAVGAKLAMLMAFLALAARAIGAGGEAAAALPVASSLPEPGWPAFAASLVWVSFSYSGWNAATYVGAEIRDPARNLPRALLLGCGIVTLLYLLVNGTILAAAPPDLLAGREDVAAAAATALGGGWTLHLLRAAATLALFTSVSALLQGGPRVAARMAEDGFLPRVFAYRGVDAAPRAAVLLQCSLALALVWWTGLRELLGAIGFTLGLCAAATVAALMRLRILSGAAAVPVPGWPFTPLLVIAATLGSSVFLALREPRIALWGAAAIVSGLPLLLLRRRG
jgi:APA family basic amino acid/polyamine antiporter